MLRNRVGGPGLIETVQHRWVPELRTVATLARQRVVRPSRPDRLLRILLAWRRWGATLPLGYAIGAVRHPDRPAVIDERGALSYAEVDQRTTRLAQALRARGIHSTTRVGVLCRNHHGLLEGVVACGKLGVDVVLLSTALGPQQLAALITEQRIRLLFVDAEFTGRLPDDVDTVLAWTEGTTDLATLEHLISRSSAQPLPQPPRHARIIVLTSGTTATPKGALRPDPPGLSPAATILSSIPMRDGERMLICAPLFHTWGLGALQLGAVLGATLVLRRTFEPEQAMAAVRRHRCTVMVVVPLMLRRILDASPERAESLRVVASSGAPLPGDLAARFQRVFGPVLYNVYGSTEVSWVSVASPKDMVEAPGTAGRPPRGTTLRILDDAGEPVAPGEAGQVFVHNDMLFGGYTDGSGRQTTGGLMATGDIGRLDSAGRLFLVGRADDMIISGGENVYPQQTEDVIAAFPEVAEVAVIGVDDAEFGRRLAAFVVLRAGQPLDEQVVRDRVRSTLPAFAVPRDVHFVDVLPRNATGKVMARELRADRE
jgi:acyl-CoA synthetase (AMP-forming)/AMP-acid ligase II